MDGWMVVNLEKPAAYIRTVHQLGGWMIEKYGARITQIKELFKDPSNKDEIRSSVINVELI